MCWNKALTFGVGSIKFTYHCVHAIHACKDVFNPNVTIYVNGTRTVQQNDNKYLKLILKW